MATEKIIKGKRCRYYTNGYIWVSEEGIVVAIKSKSGSWKYLSVNTDGNGEKYVDTGYRIIYVKKAVFTCFCYCDTPNKTQIWYKDGNPANLYYKNLVAREPQSFHTTAPTFEHISGLTITKEGKVFYNGEEVRICDCVGDADTDSLVCVEPYVSNPKGRGHLNIDDLMADAGYISGDEYALENPVILHKDYNPINFDSSNLEWVEVTDPRYTEYKNKKAEWKHQRNIELNPSKPLHPGR